MSRERRPSSAVDTAATQQRRRSGTEETTALEVAARSLLLSSIRTIGSGAGRLVYPASSCDCDDEVAVDGVVDSTTTLVAARALSKLGRSDLAWDFLRTMFAAQGSDGFMPRFAYLNRTTTTIDGGASFEGARWEEFAGDHPGPKLFPAAPGGRAPPFSRVVGETDVRVWSSNTISASPHHSTAVLEIFYLSNQTDAE
jgi:hypothetical protein